MKKMSFRIVMNESLLLTWAAFAAYGQIAQTHPELCGKTDGVVVLQRNITASASGEDTILTIKLTPSTVNIKMGAVDEVQQICPIAGGKLVAYGFIGGVAAYDIEIIDGSTGSVLDSFVAYSPVMSPDQRWIVYRSFYAPQSELSLSEEYLLYDLTAGPNENRIPNPETGQAEDRGRVIYPAVPNGVPFNNLGLPPEQIHHLRSTGFFWARDSKSVVFADEIGGEMSIVWVSLNPDDNPIARVHPVRFDNICGKPEANQSTAILTLSNATVIEGPNGSQELHARFTSDKAMCEPGFVVLAPGAFARAESEHPAPPIRRKPAVKKRVE
jgi:hypothetical protein